MQKDNSQCRSVGCSVEQQLSNENVARLLWSRLPAIMCCWMKAGNAPVRKCATTQRRAEARGKAINGYVHCKQQKLRAEAGAKAAASGVITALGGASPATAEE